MGLFPRHLVCRLTRFTGTAREQGRVYSVHGFFRRCGCSALVMSSGHIFLVPSKPVRQFEPWAKAPSPHLQDPPRQRIPHAALKPCQRLFK